MLNIKETTKYGKLDPEFKAQWVEALRSGKYLQGHKVLRTDEEFCCLGVACDLIDPLEWSSSPPRYNQYTWLGHKAFINPYVRMKMGLDFETMRGLAELNDEEGYSFDQIADWIEENL